MPRNLLLLTVVPLLACSHASNGPQLSRKGGDRGLFVGHTTNGTVVVAAKHYDAMNGMAVLADDIEGTNVDDGSTLLCRREMVTGSHYPQWICRQKEDQERVSEADRAKARMFFQSMNQACTDNCANR
jgi:hypothetical protein